MKPFLIPILMFLFGVLLYSGTVNHGFVYDDEIVIIQNTHVQKGIQGISAIWTHNYLNGVSGYNDGLYRPVSPTMFAIEKDLFGSEPFAHHVINALTYGLVGLALYAFCMVLFAGNPIPSVLVTALFIAHPIHTEVVANIKSRDEIMAALFSIMAMFWCLKIGKSVVKGIVLTLLFFLLALFSKESSLSLVAVLPLLYWVHYKLIDKSFWVLIAALIVAGGTWFWWHERIIDSMPQQIDPGLFSDLSNAVLLTDVPLDRIATGLWITVIYVWKTVIPYPLVCDYSPNAVTAVEMFSAQGLGSLFFLAAIFFLGVYLLIKGNRLAGLGIIGFFLMLAPVSNIFIHIGTTIGERLAFMPSLGWAITLGVALSSIKPQFIKPVGGVLIAVFSIMTVSRAADWESNLQLYSADIHKQPNSFRTHYNYASALSASVGDRTGDKLTPRDRENLEVAVNEFKRVLEIRPDYADAYNNLGNSLRKLGRVEEALVHFRYLVKAKPDYQKGLYNLAIIYYERHQHDSAYIYFKAHTQMPHINTAASWYFAGICSGYLGQFERSIEEFNQSLAQDNTKYDAWNFLGMAYGNLGRHDKAFESFRQADAMAGGKVEQIRNNLEQARKAMERQAEKP